jgi:glycosyltransferase involved in cell wall biosynthesis
MYKRKIVLIAAYDVSLHTSEGYIAVSFLARIDPEIKVILLTRINNVSELCDNFEFKASCPNVKLIGYDLPKFLTCWKKGARGYRLYAYLWQISWPFTLKFKRRLIKRLSVVHTLNFHNDSIPNMGWILGMPTVWGPINHNEATLTWRMKNWPIKMRINNTLKAVIRRLAWRLDPLLKLSILKTDVVFSAGNWVDQRLGLRDRVNVQRKSQLGFDVSMLPLRRSTPSTALSLVIGGRLDWIKGIDLALHALALLPHNVTLTLIGDGPCKSFLIERARKLSILERVKFLPAVSREQLLQHYADHDIFLFPSAETGGLAWVEALAVGLPIVGFDGHTELADISTHLPGIKLAKDLGAFEENVKELAKTIQIIASESYDPVILSTAAQDHYGWEIFASDIQDVYRNIANKKNKISNSERLPK